MSLFKRCVLLQPPFAETDINRHYIAYCKRHQVITRKMCRIGYIKRFISSSDKEAAIVAAAAADNKHSANNSTSTLPSSQTQLPNSASVMLRGLVANKFISKDENIVMMPVRACLHPGLPFKCFAFTDLIPRSLMNNVFSSECYLQCSRLSAHSIIRYNQFFVTLFITYLLIIRKHYNHLLSSLNGADVLHLIDFVPRNEGDFEMLYTYMQKQLLDAEVSRQCMQILCEHFNNSQMQSSNVVERKNVSDVTQCITFEHICECVACLLCILFSRQIPVSYKPILNIAFQDTPFSRYYQPNNVNLCDKDDITNKSITACTSNNNNNNNNFITSEPISFMCPLIDMCNHSTNSENVAVMVPDPSSANITEPVIMLRSLRDINVNEELTVNYEASERELKLVYGMNPILYEHNCLQYLQQQQQLQKKTLYAFLSEE